MGEHTDKLKGNVKQTVGDLTDDEQLEAEGKSDELAGKAKGAIDDVKEAASDAVDWVKDKLS